MIAGVSESPGPMVSVIVPSRNRASYLRDCLAALRAQDYPGDRYEILVVDDGSTDETPAFLRRTQEAGGPQFSWIRHPEPKGPAVARNAGIERASGDLLCFVDDDILPPPQWLTEMVAGAMRHPRGESFAGRILLLAEGKTPRTCGREVLGESELDLGEEEHNISYGLTGGNMAMTREALTRVGSFQPALHFYGEDTEWQHRLIRRGGTTVYLPLAWVHHRRSAGELRLYKILRRQFAKGRSWPMLAPYLQRQVSVLGGVRVILLGLAHAARRMCWVGVFRAAYGCGYTWETITRLLRDPHTPSLVWVPTRSHRKEKGFHQ